MKFNKKLKLFWLVTALLVVGPLAGQDLKMNGFAGEDQCVYFVYSSENPYKEVTLGSNDPGTTDANCVFSWKVISSPEGAHYEFVDGHSNRPKLRIFTGGDYIVEVTRVSKYGYQTETVCVTTKNEVILVSAISNKDCWENGDDVNPSHFELITDPPGFDYLVEVHPEDRIIGGVTNWYGDEEVRFRIRKPDDDTYQDCDVTANIFVSYGTLIDLSTNVTGLDGPKLPSNLKTMKTLYQSIQNSQKLVNKFDGLFDLIMSCTDPNSSPIHPIKKADFNMDMAINMSCCAMDDGQVHSNAYFQMGGSLDLFAGVELRVPIFPPNPKFGLFLIGSAGFGVKADGVFQFSTHCFDPGVDFQAYFSGSVRLQAAALDPDILSVEVGFYFDVAGCSQIRVFSNPMVTFDNIYLYAYMKGSFTLIGFNVEFLNYSFEKKPLFVNKDNN